MAWLVRLVLLAWRRSWRKSHHEKKKDKKNLISVLSFWWDWHGIIINITTVPVWKGDVTREDSQRRFLAQRLMPCNMGARTIFGAIFALRGFESLWTTCNMLPQQIIALKIVCALCYTASTFSATIALKIVPCNITLISPSLSLRNNCTKCKTACSHHGPIKFMANWKHQLDFNTQDPKCRPFLALTVSFFLLRDWWSWRI